MYACQEQGARSLQDTTWAPLLSHAPPAWGLLGIGACLGLEDIGDTNRAALYGVLDFYKEELVALGNGVGVNIKLNFKPGKPKSEAWKKAQSESHKRKGHTVGGPRPRTRTRSLACSTKRRVPNQDAATSSRVRGTVASPAHRYQPRLAQRMKISSGQDKRPNSRTRSNPFLFVLRP